MGIVTLEDFKSSGELALFGEDWTRWNGILTEGNAVYITARCAARFANSNYLEFKVSNIALMADVKEKQIEKMTITIDSDAVDDTLVNDLCTMIDNNAEDAHTQLFVQFRNVETKDIINMRSQKFMVNANKQLLNYIETHPKMSFHIN